MPNYTLKNISPDLYQRIKDAAARESRSIANYIIHAVKTYMEKNDG